MARRRKKGEDEVAEPNLLPVMNIMFLLIPALLLAMEVASMAAINVSPPKFAAQADQKDEKKEEQKEPLKFKVFVMDDGFRTSTANQQTDAAAGQVGTTKQPDIPRRTGQHTIEDDGYEYAQLEAKAKNFKQLFPHETVVTVSAENNIPMQTLVRTMDALRGSECKLASASGEDIPDECYFWQVIVEAGAG